MVSNHGGRQLDGSRAPFDQLAEIVDAVGDRIEVICDGGVRRGTHVLKALAHRGDRGFGRPALPLRAGRRWRGRGRARGDDPDRGDRARHAADGGAHRWANSTATCCAAARRRQRCPTSTAAPTSSMKALNSDRQPARQLGGVGIGPQRLARDLAPDARGEAEFGEQDQARSRSPARASPPRALRAVCARRSRRQAPPARCASTRRRSARPPASSGRRRGGCGGRRCLPASARCRPSVSALSAIVPALSASFSCAFAARCSTRVAMPSTTPDAANGGSARELP